MMGYVRHIGRGSVSVPVCSLKTRVNDAARLADPIAQGTDSSELRELTPDPADGRPAQDCQELVYVIALCSSCTQSGSMPTMR